MLEKHAPCFYSGWERCKPVKESFQDKTCYLCICQNENEGIHRVLKSACESHVCLAGARCSTAGKRQPQPGHRSARRRLSNARCTKTERATTKGQRKEAETRKISVTARTMKDFTGSPREDGENPSREAFKNCVGQTSAGKV